MAFCYYEPSQLINKISFIHDKSTYVLVPIYHICDITRDSFNIQLKQLALYYNLFVFSSGQDLIKNCFEQTDFFEQNFGALFRPQIDWENKFWKMIKAFYFIALLSIHFSIII